MPGGELHTRWGEQELTDIADFVSEEYPDYYSAQFLLFLLGERPSVGLPSCVDGAAEVIGELDRRFPYLTYDASVLGDTIFCRRRREIQAARRLTDEGPRMTAEEIHRTAGRAFGYPSDAVDFFVERIDRPYPSVADARITLNDLLRQGEISPREAQAVKLIPYVFGGSREKVLGEVERAARWDAALPDGVDY